LHERLDDGVRADGDAGVDEDGLGLVDGDAVVHQLAGFALAENCVELCEFAAGVDAEYLARVRRVQSQHRLAVAAQDGGNLGEVELAVRIVGGELVDAGKQFGDVEGVNAGVDLADFFLCGSELLLLDDGFDLIGADAVLDAAHDASVAEGIGGLAVRMVMAAACAMWKSRRVAMVPDG